MRKVLTKYVTRLSSALLVLVMLLGLLPTMALGADEFAPVGLTLQPGSNTGEVNLNWYAGADTTDAKVRYQAEGAASYKDVDASESKAAAAAENGETVVCRATLKELAADTAYTYRLSNDGGKTWSEEYAYTTPKTDEFTFAFVGDPQLKSGNQDAKSTGKTTAGNLATETTIAQGWADTLAALGEKEVDFIASAGDQVDTTKTEEETTSTNTGNEAEYTMLFASDEMKSLPFAAAVGNHDRHQNFLDHYNLPNVQDVSGIVNSSATAAAKEATTAYGNYYYSYNNALFVVLNDSSYPASTEEAAPYISAFRQTLKAAVAEYSDYDWLIVQHHKSTESVAQHVADADIQYYVEAGFEKLMDEFHVDFVLAGHDHVYARSYAMYDGARVSNDTDALTDPEGTVYLTCNTGSGLKYYGIFDSEKLYNKENTEYPYLANGLKGSQEYLKGVYPLSTDVAVQNYIPGYTIINVKGKTVTFTTHATYAAADGSTKADEILDTFTVTQTGKRLFPDANCTRAQAITFLWRANGSPTVDKKTDFTDVADDAYYAEAVRWAVSEGITYGTGKDTFSPDANCTRAQAVSLLWRAAGSPEVEYNKKFTDVTADAYYAKAVSWAVSESIASGMGNGLFSPNTTCTQAQTVTFYWRVAGSPVVDYKTDFVDVAADAYYAKAVCWAGSEGIFSNTK